MSELVFVRHGQASFGKASYDKLSERGIEQVRILRRHWEALGETFDQLYSGTLLRQTETATELLPLVADAPEGPVQLPALNEYNGDPLIRIYLRDHSMAEGFDENIAWPITEERLFQQLFEAATARWIRNELRPAAADAHFEHWSDFRARVHGAVDELMARHRGGSRVLVSTSGGVIAMALQRVLQFPDEQVIATNWMVHNSSVTRVKYGNGRVSLTQFNSLSHLERPEVSHLITYR
ncbi:MAG: histidine phosphatase family protein [Pseudohongiellaceae bacterium]